MEKNPSKFRGITIIDVQIQYHKEIQELVDVFDNLLSTKVKLKELLEKISIYQNYILYILNILKKQEDIYIPEEKHI